MDKYYQGHQGYEAYQVYQRCCGRSSSSIHRSVQHLRRFRKWLAVESIALKAANYTDLLRYLSWERSRGIAESSIRHYLRYVRWYYDYLLAEGMVDHHPLQHLNLNRHYRQLDRVDLHTLLSGEELNMIYESYCANSRLKVQSKVLLGLLVYQGLSVKELKYLRVDHIDLVLGRVRVPESRVCQGRILELEAKQVLGLSKLIGDREPGSPLLIYTSASQSSNSRQHLKDQIKRELGKSGHRIDFKNLPQLRRSVISHWVQRYNLREAQYLAGHKWVHSTESYVQADLAELQEQLLEYHPLK